ncbi:MAG: 1-hydroxycarotenoid 3,4-desaturase CrtD [Flavobacteriales bacterium]
MKAIVIGSGIAGLATAVRLRAKGYHVEVFEANAYTGGKLTAFELGSYRFDAGPSLFTLPDLVDHLFEALGEDPRSAFNYHRHETSCRYFWPDGAQLTGHADRDAFVEEAARVLGESAEDLHAYLNRSEEAFNLTRTIFLESSLHKPLQLPRKDVFRAIGRMHKLSLTKTLHQVNAKTFHNPKTHQLFDRYATYNGSSPYKTPGIMRLIPHLELGLGTYLPMGGMHEISQSVTRLAERHGVRIHLESPVERIVVNDGQATGIASQGIFHTADVVVSSMDVVPTYRKLLADQTAPERTLSQERSSSALIFYWGIRKEFPELDLHNILFSRDYAREFRQIFDEHVVPDDPTVYINITSKLESMDAPQGSENWFVMINVPGDTGQDWDTLIPKARKAVLERISAALRTNIEPLIEVEDVLEPRTIASRTGSHQGSLYGASSNAAMAAFLRHPNFSRKLDNLYFCGGSVHPGGGIPLCLLSAKIVDQLTPAP